MTAVLILIVFLLAIAVAVLARRVVNLRRRLDRADARQKAAVKTSRSVHVGKIAEQLAPLLPGFPYNPKDVQGLLIEPSRAMSAYKPRSLS
jgi:predicted Holliday junction resolvase-like endonuclease